MRRDGANAGLLDVARAGFQGLAELVRRRRARAAPGVAVDASVMERAKSRMYAYWQTLGVNQATMESWAADALDFGEYADAVERCRRVWGSLEGKRILDYGCGWGSLSVLLARAGAQMTVLDHVPAHVEVAALRVPGGRGLVCDGRNLAAIRPEIGAGFDYVVLNSVVEHVGPLQGHRGDAASSLDAKRSPLKEAASLVAPGGGLYVSTGNYAFPLDGEIKSWFFHWLRPDVQNDILNSMGMSADYYGLLRWSEFEKLFEDAGLRVESVETVEVGSIRPLLVGLSFLSRFGGYSLPRKEIQRLLHLLAHDPRYMPAWFIFLRRDLRA